MLNAPREHGPVGPLDELVELAIPIVPFVVLSVWSLGCRVGRLLDGKAWRRLVANTETVGRRPDIPRTVDIARTMSE